MSHRYYAVDSSPDLLLEVNTLQDMEKAQKELNEHLSQVEGRCL